MVVKIRSQHVKSSWDFTISLPFPVLIDDEQKPKLTGEDETVAHGSGIGGISASARLRVF